MKKFSLLLLSAFLLVGCTSNKQEEKSIDPSSEDESSIIESLDSESSEEESSKEDSTEVVTSGEPQSDHTEEGTNFILTADPIPGQVNGQYPPKQDIEVDGNVFNIDCVNSQNGKFEGINVIQFKKSGAGTIINKTPLFTYVSIETMINTNGYTGEDYAAALSVYAGDSVDNLTTKLNYEKVEDTDTYHYNYAGVNNYRYFKIVNESSYAQYIKAIQYFDPVY